MPVTPAKQWKSSVIVTLPSGNTAEIRALDIGAFIAYGKIPDTLTALVADIAEGRDVSTGKSTVENTRDLMLFYDLICVHTFVQPRVVVGEANYDAGEISVMDLGMEDKQFVLGFFNKPARELARFRHEQARHMESAYSGESDTAATIPTDGDQAVG